MSNVVFLPNTFIIGFPKCATTALHRYLSLSEEVFAPVVKEPEYYSKGDFNSTTAEQYRSNYNQVASDERIVLDSSASYVFGSNTIPQMIVENSQNAEEVKVVVIVRNPVRRFVSFFNFLKHMNLIDNTVCIERFVDQQIGMYSAQKFPVTSEFTISSPNYVATALYGGLYYRHLKKWHEEYSSNMKVLSFEMLTQNTVEQMEEIGEFLQIKQNWKNVEFNKQNETLSHKNIVLHRGAIKLYSKLYLQLNHYPRLKQKLLSTYKIINTNKIIPAASLECIEKLTSFYIDDVQQTQSFLLSIGCSEQTAQSIGIF